MQICCVLKRRLEDCRKTNSDRQRQRLEPKTAAGETASLQKRGLCRLGLKPLSLVEEKALVVKQKVAARLLRLRRQRAKETCGELNCLTLGVCASALLLRPTQVFSDEAQELAPLRLEALRVASSCQRSARGGLGERRRGKQEGLQQRLARRSAASDERLCKVEFQRRRRLLALLARRALGGLFAAETFLAETERFRGRRVKKASRREAPHRLEKGLYEVCRKAPAERELRKGAHSPRRFDAEVQTGLSGRQRPAGRGGRDLAAAAFSASAFSSVCAAPCGAELSHPTTPSLTSSSRRSEHSLGGLRRKRSQLERRRRAEAFLSVCKEPLAARRFLRRRGNRRRQRDRRGGETAPPHPAYLLAKKERKRRAAL